MCGGGGELGCGGVVREGGGGRLKCVGWIFLILNYESNTFPKVDVTQGVSTLNNVSQCFNS